MGMKVAAKALQLGRSEDHRKGTCMSPERYLARGSAVTWCHAHCTRAARLLLAIRRPPAAISFDGCIGRIRD